MPSKFGGPCSGSTSSSSDSNSSGSTSMTVSCPIYSGKNWTLSGTGTAIASSDGIAPSIGIGVTWKI